MGIINMMIVVPMIIQTLSFGYIYQNFLGSNPANAILFAGALLLIAAVATMRMRVEKTEEERVETFKKQAVKAAPKVDRPTRQKVLNESNKSTKTSDPMGYMSELGKF